MAEDRSNQAGNSAVTLTYPDKTKSREVPASLRSRELDELIAGISRLREPQLWWLAGYVEGRLVSGQSSATPGTTGTGAADTTGHVSNLPALSILYGSQTGNAQEMAQALCKRWQEAQIRAVAHNLGRYKLNRLRKEKQVLILISTHGEGDPPDSTLAFFNALMAENAPRLEGLHYAVIGLGDISYKHFCKPARQIDERLSALGASAVCPRLECDLDYKKTIAKWENSYLSLLNADSAPKSPAPILALSPGTDPSPSHSKAEIIEKVNLCLDEADKRVWHIELQSDLPYLCGDSVAIVLDNGEETVQSVLGCLATADASTRYSFAGRENLSLQEILRHHAELHRITRAQVQQFLRWYPETKLGEIAGVEADLDEFVSRSNIASLLAYATEAIAGSRVVDLLRPMTDRLYSIASSPEAHPGEIHITVREQPYGLATPQLARLEIGAQLSVYIKPNPAFRLPEDPRANLIFIGAGTGVAPYRAFLSERLELANQGAAVGQSWLFMGEQSFFNSFLYQLDWQYFVGEGALNRISPAFSRDQKQKIYVHHRLLENAQSLYQWIKDGAHVYVCGDRQRMAHDVHQALESIWAQEARVSPEDARNHLAEMAADGRYQRDIY